MRPAKRRQRQNLPRKAVLKCKAVQKRLLLEEKLSAMPTDEVFAAGNDHSCVILWNER